MLVSRKGVLTDRIASFNRKDRFLKLDIEKYLELINITPCPPQFAIINAVNDPRFRFIVACVSRRVGKTYISNIIGQIVDLVPGSNVLIMSPNYSLSQISFELQRNLIKHFEVEVERDNTKDRIIELINGSTIRMGSVGQVDSCVGRSYDLIIFDEAALSPLGKDAFNIALRPTLDKANSKAIFISTPRGENNWFHEFYQRGFKDEFPEWVSIHATYQDNPRADLKDVEESRKTMSDAEFRQEYMADFTIFEGRIWEFDFENQVRDLTELDFREMDIFAGIDVGYKDPLGMVVFAYDYREDVYYLLDEYKATKASTSQHAEQIKRLEDKYGIDFIYVDSAHAQFRADLSVDYDITTLNAKKSVLDGISHVGALFEHNKVFVNQECIESLKAIEQYKWDTGGQVMKERPMHDWASHMSDAIRYALYTHTVSFTTF